MSIYSQAYYDRHIALGKCGNCPRERENPKFKKCNECLKRAALAAKNWRNKKIIDGLEFTKEIKHIEDATGELVNMYLVFQVWPETGSSLECYGAYTARVNAMTRIKELKKKDEYKYQYLSIAELPVNKDIDKYIQ